MIERGSRRPVENGAPGRKGPEIFQDKKGKWWQKMGCLVTPYEGKPPESPKGDQGRVK